jgi:hypothetical protein
MTRWFFPASRAHHALCMMLDHGMQFIMKGERWTAEGLANIDRTSDYKIIVAPESEHLLMPQTDDLIVFFDGTRNIRWGDLVLLECQWQRRSDDASIVQRNRLAFHWPEQESQTN